VDLNYLEHSAVDKIQSLIFSGNSIFKLKLSSFSDILIGSPGSDTVAILLSRPVIYVNVKSHPDKYFVSRSRPCEGPECFKWNICFSYRGVSVPDAIGE